MLAVSFRVGRAVVCDRIRCMRMLQHILRMLHAALPAAGCTLWAHWRYAQQAVPAQMWCGRPAKYTGPFVSTPTDCIERRAARPRRHDGAAGIACCTNAVSCVACRGVRFTLRVVRCALRPPSLHAACSSRRAARCVHCACRSGTACFVNATASSATKSRRSPRAFSDSTNSTTRLRRS